MYEAYQAGKWAFVSDYARIDILHQHGGVYLDTDVELLQSLDSFLHYSMFCGWEKSDGQPLFGSHPDEKMLYAINFGLGVGAVPGHPVMQELLQLYRGMSFYLPNGEMNCVPCPVYQTRVMQRYGLDTMHPTLQMNKYFAAFPAEYFAPKSYLTGLIEKTKNTVSIHHFAMSWKSRREMVEYVICSRLTRFMSHDKAYWWVKTQFARFDYWKRRIMSLLGFK